MALGRRVLTALGAALVATTLGPVLGAQATESLAVTSTVNPSMSSLMPVVRLHFSAPVRATQLPNLTVQPALATSWQQIGPRDVQAVIAGALKPLIRYTIEDPTALRCTTRCTFTRVRAVATSVTTNVTWEEQLLATLHYLPVAFTPATHPLDPAQATYGTFAWALPQLPARLSAQWRQGADNVIVTGALMAFQSNHGLATTGVADASTWDSLVNAVRAHQVDPHSYDYVDVSLSLPQTLTMYVNGRATFHTLVNSGIAVSPTSVGIYPVYLRYVTQTMSGKNPDGTHYSDPGIPWVSYFHGGDALHGFLRSTYGWPQSLGCVEMPFNAAQTIWPTTGIGTLVGVH